VNNFYEKALCKPENISTPRPLKMKQAPAAFVPPAANWQDSQKQLGRSQRLQKAARLRPAKAAALWARCSACRPGQDLSHSRETDQLCIATLANRSASLTKPHWSETSASGCDPAVEPAPSPFGVARSDLRSAAEDSESLASRYRDCAGHRVQQTRHKAIGFAVGWHERPARLTVLLRPRLWPRLANRQIRQHTLCVRSFVPQSLLYSDRADTPHS